MADVVRAAIVQTNWTGDKESMIKAHEEYARQAAAQGAKVICFQELFYGPYFCQVQDAEFYSYAESIPGPTTERFQALARELGMVMVLPMYEQEQPGVLYNTAAVVDADGSYLGKYRKNHIPQVKGSGRSSTSAPETSDIRSSTPRSAGSASTSATTGISRRAGARSAWPVPRSCSTVRHQPRPLRLSLAAGTAGQRGRERVLHRRDQPHRNRGARRQRFLRHVVLRRPGGKFVGEVGDAHSPELIVRDLDLSLLDTVRDRWQFYRDRVVD